MRSKFGIAAAALAPVAGMMLAAPAHGSEILVDFGPSGSVGSTTTSSPDLNSHYWNNVTSAAGLSTVVDTQNNTTGYTISLSTPTSGFSGLAEFNTGTAFNGSSTSAIGDLNIATASEDATYAGSAAGAYFNVTLSNLDPTITYTLSMFGSRDATDVRYTDFTLSGASVSSASLETTGTNVGGSGVNHNTSNLAVLSAQPNPSTDTLVLTVATGNTSGNEYAYLNSLEISYTPEPASLALLGVFGGAGLLSRRRRLSTSKSASTPATDLCRKSENAWRNITKPQACDVV